MDKKTTLRNAKIGDAITLNKLPNSFPYVVSVILNKNIYGAKVIRVSESGSELEFIRFDSYDNCEFNLVNLTKPKFLLPA